MRIAFPALISDRTAFIIITVQDQQPHGHGVVFAGLERLVKEIRREGAVIDGDYFHPRHHSCLKRQPVFDRVEYRAIAAN